MIDSKSVELKPGTEKEVLDLIQGDIPEVSYEWKPLGGITYDEWRKQVGGHCCEQGTLMNTDRGVWVSGMCGAIRIGVKRSDGTIDRKDTPEWGDIFMMSPEIKIFEFADPPSDAGYHRNARGAISSFQCDCGRWHHCENVDRSPNDPPDQECDF